MTRNLASEFAPRKIRVNQVTPGATRTPDAAEHSPCRDGLTDCTIRVNCLQLVSGEWVLGVEEEPPGHAVHCGNDSRLRAQHRADPLHNIRQCRRLHRDDHIVLQSKL